MSESERSDDYLWDRSGAADPELRRLETLLAPFAHDGHPLAQIGAGGGSGWRGSGWRGGPGSRGVLIVLLSAAAAALLIAYVALDWEASEPRLVAGGKFTPSRQIVLEDELTRLTVDAGSILYVDRLEEEIRHLRLERGRLQAFVYAGAKERFFQVRTPSTNCVDLGCMYTLEVDTEKNAYVVVQMGRVAFEDEAKVVVVPADATCRATRRAGAGTPRYVDTPSAVVQALDEYDTHAGVDGQTIRARMAARILAFLAGEQDPRVSLIPWHFLQDPSPAVSSAAAAWLVRHRPAQTPAGFAFRPSEVVGREHRQAWRAALEEEWGW